MLPLIFPLIYNVFKIVHFYYNLASMKCFCYSNIVIKEQTFPAERGTHMANIEQLKIMIVDVLKQTQDAELLDLILKLLLAEG